MYQVWLNSLHIYSSYHPKTKIWACQGQITPSKIDEICPFVIPKQISTISMHIPSLVKIHGCLLKLSPGNENMGLSRADNSVNIWRNLPISNPKPNLHNINAHTKFGEKFINVYSSYHPETKYGRTDGGRTTDGRTDVQRETIIPRGRLTVLQLEVINGITLRYMQLLVVMRKRVFGHMWTAEVQISLRISAVWSGPSLSANRIIGYYRMYEWRAKIRMIGLCDSTCFTHA